MKDAIKSGDWAGVGSLVAEKVNGAFAYINWDGIQKKLNSFVDKLTDGLNSFIKPAPRRRDPAKHSGQPEGSAAENERSNPMKT